MILTHDYLKRRYDSKLLYLNESTLFNEINENKRYFSTRDFDVFLSHSYLDKNEVVALYDLFKEKGFSVYVDWMQDSQLDRSMVTKETAIILKNRMKRCKGLLYLTTENIQNSKWCPWELGYFDGLKDRCAILPILERQQSNYKGSEYLGIYPYIEYEKANNSANEYFWVCDNDTKKVSELKAWLNGSSLS